MGLEDKISIYKENIVSLPPAKFLTSVYAQTSICDMQGYELTKQLAHCFTFIAAQMRVTNEINDIDKKEIKELLLGRFKRLSVNEVYYAFKLERFGEYGEITSHYNRFDVIYVGQILDKYVNWKISTKQRHNISAIEETAEQSEEEKKYWINKAVNDCMAHFEKTREVEEGKSYVYDILYDDGVIQVSNEEKKKFYEDAKEVIVHELENSESANKKEASEKRNIYKEIRTPKSPKVIVKAKELILADFFRKCSKDEDVWANVKSKYLMLANCNEHTEN